MLWQAALFYHSGLEMVKKQCQVWSPMCTNFSSFNKATARPIWDKIKQESQMAYDTAESFPGVYVFCIDIMNNLTIFAGKPRKQTHLIIVREKHLLHKVL